jgi:filamentous hemagglutinin
MTLEADQVENRYSLLAANGDLTITAHDLLNQGASTRVGTNVTQIGTPGQIDTAFWDQMEFVDVPAFKAALAAGNFDLAWFELLKARSSDGRFEELSNVTEWRDSGDVTEWRDSGDMAYAATLQSGGKITLNVANSVQNGTIRENTLAQLTGQMGDDQTGPVDIDLSKRVADGDVLAGAGFDPTSASGFRLPKGDYGLFIKSKDPTARYLVEGNPNLTDLSRFLGSDYLFGLLGYSADGAWRRLGDGFYESRLIRDAVLARTGQRFLSDDLSSDEEQFRYLMDNAAASKKALSLSVGVGLSAEQVGALTHDIVWMENRVVEGQTVLVPVLYLAQAESRNVRGNSLIQGRELALISGGDLLSVGTLRGKDTVSINTAGSLYQGGLIEAGNTLALLAQDSIRNAMAGEIRGSDVSLVAINGDIINDRTAAQVRDGSGMRTVLDGPSVIHSNNHLTLLAGQDISNRGAISAGTDASLTAGRDINLLATVNARERHDIADGGHRYTVSTDVKNLAATVSTGGNLSLTAGRDINVVASKASAAQDLSLNAGRDITVVSATDLHSVETRSKNGHKRVTERDDRQTQVGSLLSAGHDFNSTAVGDTTLIASHIEAGNDAHLDSGGRISLLAGQNSTSTLYDRQDKGGWGAEKSKRDEVTDVIHVGSGIKTGGNLSLVSGGDQLYQRAKLDSGNDLTLTSGGAVTFEAVKDLHQESHVENDSDLAWFSMKGEGRTDETVRQSELTAQGNLVINAVQGLKIDVKKVDQQTVSQTIEAMVTADPQLAWLKTAEQRGDVDWRQVAEIHESFKYDNAGLGPAAQIAVAILMAWAVGPTVMVAATEAGAAASIAAAAGAVATSASTTAAVSVVNNRGNLGAVLKEVTSSDSLKGYAISGITAGLTDGYFDALTGTAGKVPALTLQGIGGFAANQALQGVTSTALSKALGQGGSVNEALKGALFNTLAATAFNLVGDYTAGVIETGTPSKVVIHAMVGGLLAKATGGDFKTGALAAGVNEAVVGHLDGLVQGNEALLTMSSQMIGLLAAAAQKDTDADKLQQGVWVAKNATEYNYLLHKDLEAMHAELAASKSEAEKRQIHEKYAKQNEDNNAALGSLCKANPDVCRQISDQLQQDEPKLDALAKELYAKGEIQEGTLIAAFFQQENMAARLQIASELGAIKNGEGSRLLNELGAVLLGGARADSGPSKKPANNTTSRPTHQASESDVGPTARPQVSFEIGQEVPYGAKAIPEISYPSLAKPSPNAPSNVIFGELDSLGRPTGVTAVLREDSLGGGSSANPAIRPPGFEGQPANHARGHLLANSLGGSGDDARNLVTLFQRNANHPNMSSFERQVRGAVQSGETVSYRAVPTYTGTNPMPTGVTLSARGSGGFTLDVSIPNISGVK